MAPLRSLLVLLIFAGLIGAATAVAQAPVEWYGATESGGGGALAGSVPDPAGADTASEHGGALAPAYTAPVGSSPAPPNLPPPTEVPVDDSPAAVAASVRAARAGAPSGPTGARPAGGERAPAGADATPRVDARPASSDWAPLRFESWELAALALGGLCLLVGGAALRPRALRR